MGKASKQTKSETAIKSAKASNNSSNAMSTTPPVSKDIAAEHLPPIGLVFTVIACSGFLFMFAFRDVFATGRNIGGARDEAMLEFTKSIRFFNDAKGWKSTQGGLSTILPITTDENDMGGLFVRKVGGAAALAVQFQKLMPLVVHPMDARWKMGHFRPLFWTAVVSNIMLVAFYSSYLGDLANGGADGLVQIFIAVLAVESVVILGYLYSSRDTKRGHAVAMPAGKTHTSIVSRIVARTVMIVSGVVALLAARDFFFPGEIMKFVPRDDIYLEWTNAFLHSPPDGSPEAEDNGLTAAMYIADKFLSQFMALNLLILCMYKFVSACLIKFGSDGSGVIKTKMIWRAQFFGDGIVLFLVRLFSSAAVSASLDLRWHLMALAYETFIFGLYGFL